MSILVPNEILIEILKLLPEPDKRTVRLVCLQLNELIKEHYAAIHLFSNFCPEINSDTLTTVRAIHPKWRIQSLLITDSSMITFHRNELRSLMKDVTTLTIRQKEGRGVISEVLMLKLIHCSSGNLTSLSLVGVTMFALTCRTYCYLNFNLDELRNLETLKVGFEGRRKREAVLVFLARLEFRHLRSFSLLIADQGQPKLSKLEYQWVSILIATHRKTLKHLEIEDNGWGMVDGRSDDLMKAAERVRVRAAAAQGGNDDPLTFLEDVRLESLTLVEGVETRICRWSFQGELFRCQDSLKRVRFGVDWPGAFLPFRIAVEQSSNTLESIKFKTHRQTQTCHDCSYLIDCYLLKELHLESNMQFFNVSYIPNSVEILSYIAPMYGVTLEIFLNDLVNLKKFTAFIALWDAEVIQILQSWDRLLQLPELRELEIWCSHSLFCRLVEETRPFDKKYAGPTKSYSFKRFGRTITVKCRHYLIPV